MQFNNLTATEREACETYYKLWKKGASESELQIAVGLSSERFEKQVPQFLAYCRHHNKHDTRESLVNGEPPDHIKLTPERREEFLNYAVGGMSMERAAKAMNVPIPTVLEVWFVSDPLLKEEMAMSSEKADAKMQLALYKRGTGYSYLSKQKSVVRNKITADRREELKLSDSDHGYITTETLMETEKQVAGDVNAQKFWLINKNPDKWTLDGEGNKESNKGALLTLLDKMLGRN